MPTSQQRTSVSLREYLETHIEALERANEIKCNSNDKRIEAIEEDIRSLRESRAELQGKASQFSFMVTLIISLLGFVVALISLFLRFFGM